MSGQDDPLVEALRSLVDARLGRTPPPSERAGVLAVWRDVWRGREAQAPEAARAYLRDARWWPAPGEVLRLAPAPEPVAAPSGDEPPLMSAGKRLCIQWLGDRMGATHRWHADHERLMRSGAGVPAWDVLLDLARMACPWRDADAVSMLRDGERRLRAAGALPPLELWTWAPLAADVWGAA